MADEVVHLIERSAYDTAIKERDEWKRKATECQGILNMELHDKLNKAVKALKEYKKLAAFPIKKGPNEFPEVVQLHGMLTCIKDSIGRLLKDLGEME